MALLFTKKDKGFTLLEMMTVIAIMGILSAIAIPNFISYSTGMKLRSASRDVYSTLQNTRMKAIRQSTRWAVLFNGAVSYRVIDCGADNTCGNTDDDNNGSERKPSTRISSGVSMSQSFAGNLLIFNSEGTSNAGTVVLTDARGKTSSVEVAASGRVRVVP